MSSFRTGLRENIAALYNSHGGPRSLVRSAYFWVAVVLTILSWRKVADESWAAIAQSVLPTLTGFSIASFAILFAILDARARRALRAPDPRLDNRSPLLILAGSVAHAVVVQVIAILFSIVFTAKPFPVIAGLYLEAVTLTWLASALGLLLLLYAIVLVLATVLTIFRMLELAA